MYLSFMPILKKALTKGDTFPKVNNRVVRRPQFPDNNRLKRQNTEYFARPVRQPVVGRQPTGNRRFPLSNKSNKEAFLRKTPGIQGVGSMASTIGIKIANGEFYSLVEENSTVKKRLVLTTVHDNQHSVQIDLYKSYTKTMADAFYIGSLVVEKIRPRPRGEPSIEMVISSTKEGEITADAIDMDTSSQGEHQILNVSLKSLDEDNREYDIPDFELEQNETPPTGLYDRASAVKKEDARGFPWIVVIIIGVALVLILLALWYFLFRGKPGSGPADPVRTEAVPAEETPPARGAAPEPPAPAAKPPASQTAQEPPPVIQAPEKISPAPAVDRRNRPPAPVSSYKVPETIPKEGAPYKIRWGDTLWDISEAFYRNPWLYPRIARFNNISNPNLIISGTTIKIPPR
jgi:LysM repeat protein